jgi:hypothetical protein
MIVRISSSSGKISWKVLLVIAPVFGVIRMKGISSDLDKPF